MRRREFLKTFGTTIASSGAALAWKGQHAYAKGNVTSQANRPNILYIMTDQQFAGAMSCAGNKYLKTPAMDSIAENGVLFEKAYCADPLCVPSRTVMMTGRMPHETGITYNVRAKRDSVRLPMMGTILSRAGYDCGYVGKWHIPNPTDQVDLHGFTTVQLTKLDNRIQPACADFISRKRDNPFLLVASFVNPHDICGWPSASVGGRNLRNGPIPEAPPAGQCPPLPDNFEIPPCEPDIIRAMQELAPRWYSIASEWNGDTWRQYRWAYYRLVEKVDEQIGIVLDALRKSGQEDNTLIIFASDHGDGMGAHRWNQKMVLYEETTRVPFIVSFKGVTRPGYVNRGHLVSTGLDLIPTMCDYAGIKPPDALLGASVRALAEGRKPKAWRDFVVTETEFGHQFGQGDGVYGRMLRTARYKYVVYSEGNLREQLTDMERDPGEMVNLVESPKHKAILEGHRRRLAAWCKGTNDFFVVPKNG